MVRTILASFSLWLVLAGTAAGQATVEAGLGAARAVTTTAPARGIGKSMSGLAGSLDKALKGGQTGSSEQAAGAVASKPGTQTATKTESTPAKVSPTPATNWEDPGGIETGLAYDDLVRRFGPSSMAITAGTERSLTYRGKDGLFQVKVQDGVVTSIEKPQPKA